MGETSFWQVALAAAMGLALGYSGGFIAPRWMVSPPAQWKVGLLAVITGLVTGLLALEHPLTPYFWHQVIFLAILTLAAFVDLHDRIIPNELMLFGVAAGLLLMLVTPYPELSWFQALGGGLAGGGFFLILALLVPGGMGMGDVKLAGVMGLFIGLNWIGMSLIFAFLLGGLISALVLALRLVGRKGHIPFGPFLAIGGIITILYGWEIWVWYSGRL